MKTNEYLYGKNVNVPNISKEVIEHRLQLLNSHLSDLLAVDYTVRDIVRCNDIVKAIRFWENINNGNTH